MKHDIFEGSFSVDNHQSAGTFCTGDHVSFLFIYTCIYIHIFTNMEQAGERGWQHKREKWTTAPIGVIDLNNRREKERERTLSQTTRAGKGERLAKDGEKIWRVKKCGWTKGIIKVVLLYPPKPFFSFDTFLSFFHLTEVYFSLILSLFKNPKG